MARSDDELFVDCLASQLSWLPTVGAGEQWKDGHSREKTLKWSRDFMERSDAVSPWGTDWCRAYVAEAKTGAPAAVLILETKAPKYVGHGLAEQDKEDPFLYMTFVVTNRDIAEQSKGSGTALIRFAIDLTRSMGMKRLCLDCWRGNDRKLVQ